MRFQFAVGAALSAVWLHPFPAAGVVIRHDVPMADSLALAADPAFASVGRIPMNGVSATGVLISDHHVVTAAHVVDGLVLTRFTIGGHTFRATEVTLHPSWLSPMDLAGLPGVRVDLAVLTFAEDIAARTGITPVPLYRGAAELGEIATLVGFGRGGDGLTGPRLPSGTRRAAENRIDIVTALGLGFDFDDPAGPIACTGACNHWDPVALPLEGMIAPGDSGGALFVDGHLAGIASATWASAYGQWASYARVSFSADWIDAAVEGANWLPAETAGPGQIAVPEPTGIGLVALGLLAFARRQNRPAPKLRGVAAMIT